MRSPASRCAPSPPLGCGARHPDNIPSIPYKASPPLPWAPPSSRLSSSPLIPPSLVCVCVYEYVCVCVRVSVCVRVCACACRVRASGRWGSEARSAARAEAAAAHRAETEGRRLRLALLRHESGEQPEAARGGARRARRVAAASAAASARAHRRHRRRARAGRGGEGVSEVGAEAPLPLVPVPIPVPVPAPARARARARALQQGGTVEGARGVQIVGTVSATGGTFTGRGYDIWGVPMSQPITVAAGASTGWSTKCFKYISSVTPNFTDNTHNYTVGTSDVFDFHYRNVRWEDTDVSWAGTYVTNSTGWVGADTTAIATATTGDTCGTTQVSTSGGGSPVTGAAASNGTVSSLAMSGRWLAMGQFLAINDVLRATADDQTALFGSIQA